MKSWIEELHSNDQKYMMITDPGIMIDYEYNTFIDGLENNVYVKNDKNENLLGRAWPGYVYFPDFFHPNSTEYWFRQLKKFHEAIGFDGIWLDMNEVTSLCDGECRLNSSSNSLNFDPNNPPYKPLNGGEPLYLHTISLSAKQYISTVYNLHNLYGWSETKATRIAMDKILNKRSLIITRSTFASSGKFAAHWLGDNYSTWKDLHLSISGLVTMGLFGIPMAGADICGFNGNTTKELCLRWTQLGSFYPFSRNHNAIGMIPQEPYEFGIDFSKIATTSINLKYSLLPFYYTLFYHSKVEGDPVARGLFYEFYNDPNVFLIDEQFLIGPSLLISPVLKQGARNVNAYFPDSRWFDIYTGIEIVQRASYISLNAPLDKINVHVRGGFIITRQKPKMTTKQTKQTLFDLLIALDDKGNAKGDLYDDDGESFHVIETKKITLVDFQVQSSRLNIKSMISGYSGTPNLDQILIFGESKVNEVFVNGVKWEKWDYKKGVFKIIGLDLNLRIDSSISWQ